MPPKRKRENSADALSDAGSSSDPNILKANKDRECPFCHQAFTSSSLGRHLDLYIRPVNAKQSDGIHNVDEIRRIRGGITRRQPKGSSKSSRDREGLREHSVHEVRSDPGDTEDWRHEGPPRHLPRPPHNGMDWRTTGVINEARHPPSATGKIIDQGNGKTPGPQLPPIGSPISRRHDEGIEEQLETGKAAELALREVMNSLAAARQEHDNAVLFDGLDLCTLSFPAICLTVLPAPRTLFSTTPFPDAESFDLRPPLQRERQCVEATLDRRRMPRQIYDHVAAAYQQWLRLSGQEQSVIWTTEVLRAFDRTKRTGEELRTQLSLARQRVVHLENEYELLSRCQLPRERLLNPPATLPITRSTLDYMAPESTTDALIDKWRSAVRTVAKPKKFASSQLSRMNNYASSAVKSQESNNGKEPGTLELSADIIMHGAVYGVGGAIPRDGQYARMSTEVVPYGKPVTEMVDKG